MLLDAEDSQLVLVDYQERLLPALSEGAQALANAVRLARMAQMLEVPVLGTEQSPDKLGPNAHELRSLCLRTLQKTSFGAVSDGLADWLRPVVKQQGAMRAAFPSICRSLPLLRLRGDRR